MKKPRIPYSFRCLPHVRSRGKDFGRTYDGLNRRVRKTTASETREYYYNKNWQCLEEYLYGTLQNSYLWDLRYLDDLICFTPDYTIALTDANFNVVAVANQSGLTERYTYTAFGQRTILTQSYAPRSESVYPALTRTFTSQVLDHETGVMLYRNRYYAPTLGRFITRDPIGYEGKDPSLYRHLKNCILSDRDPFGTESCNTCSDFLKQAIKNMEDEDLVKMIVKCKIVVKCQSDCNGFDGLAFYKNGYVFICFSEQSVLNLNNPVFQLEALLLHELTHAKQFKACEHKPSKEYEGDFPAFPEFTNIPYRKCKSLEKKAYENQFKHLYPRPLKPQRPNNPNFKDERRSWKISLSQWEIMKEIFVEAGVFYSCRNSFGFVREHICDKPNLNEIQKSLCQQWKEGALPYFLKPLPEIEEL